MKLGTRGMPISFRPKKRLVLVYQEIKILSSARDRICPRRGRVLFDLALAMLGLGKEKSFKSVTP